MGLSLAGFRHKAVIEKDPDACETIRANQRRKVAPVVRWPLSERDVNDFVFEDLSPGTDLVAAGVPCQPWSLGGKHKGCEDQRNLFPDTIAIINKLRPKAILIENVKGLLRGSFASYFEYIMLTLEFPSITLRQDETWIEHRARLERHKTSTNNSELRYNCVYQLLNAANYGVPQKRERVFIVGFRSDLNVQWAFPDRSHSEDALLVSKWVTGAYWDEYKISKSARPEPPAESRKQIEKLRSEPCVETRWRTVRDAIRGLTDPRKRSCKKFNHVFQPGARSYAGHTGSVLDEPAKTLKAGDHGVPGGENMLVLPDGDLRYFTVRESARLQTFPDDYWFVGSWTETMRQLGNAVPVTLAQVVAQDILRHVASGQKELLNPGPHAQAPAETTLASTNAIAC